jgi:hypothetical protein
VLFFASALTAAGAERFGSTPLPIARHFARMKQLHWTDWFLNRVLMNVLWGAERLAEGRARNFRRDDSYYADAAFKRLTAWRRLVRDDGISSPTQRGLKPLNDDHSHVALWDSQRCDTVAELRAIMLKLVPYLELQFSNFDMVPHCGAVTRR